MNRLNTHMNIVHDTAPFNFITFFCKFVLFRKMGGEFWESFSYFGTELSVRLDPQFFFHEFSFSFFRFFVLLKGSFFCWECKK